MPALAAISLPQNPRDKTSAAEPSGLFDGTISGNSEVIANIIVEDNLTLAVRSFSQYDPDIDG